MNSAQAGSRYFKDPKSGKIVEVPGNLKDLPDHEKIRIFHEIQDVVGTESAKQITKGKMPDGVDLNNVTAETVSNAVKVANEATMSPEQKAEVERLKKEGKIEEVNHQEADGYFSKKRSSDRRQQRLDDHERVIKRQIQEDEAKYERKVQKARAEGKPEPEKPRSLRKHQAKSKITGFGLIGALADGYFTYQAEREEDPSGSQLADMAKAGTVAAGWLFFEPVMWGLMAKDLVGAAGQFAWEQVREDEDAYLRIKNKVTKDNAGRNRGSFGGEFINNEMTSTMRQRQEQIMRQHRIATETVMGSEARQLHR